MGHLLHVEAHAIENGLAVLNTLKSPKVACVIQMTSNFFCKRGNLNNSSISERSWKWRIPAKWIYVKSIVGKMTLWLGYSGRGWMPKWAFWASKSFCSWLKTCLNADKSNQYIHIPQPPWIMVFQLKLSASRSPPEPFMRQPAAELGGMWLTFWQKWIGAKQSFPTQSSCKNCFQTRGTKLWLWLTVGSRCRWLNGGGCNERWLYLIDN